jgi:hypothetical protein
MIFFGRFELAVIMLLIEDTVDRPVTVVRLVRWVGRGSGWGVAAGRRMLLIAALEMARWGRVGAGRWVVSNSSCQRPTQGQ